VSSASADAVTINYDLGDTSPDRAWNGDGLHLSAEARLRSADRSAESLERLRVRAGFEGLEAKIDLVRNGEAKPHFAGVSLKDGYFKGQVKEAGEYLKDHPAAAVGVAAGAIVAAHEIAKRTGDDIKVDTGKIKLYQQGGLTASVVGEVAITGDKDWVRAQGARLNLGYTDSQMGDLSLEAGYDRDSRTKVEAKWAKTYSSGLEANARVFYEEKNRNTGVQVGLSYRF
jgi:hypothetical protein